MGFKLSLVLSQVFWHWQIRQYESVYTHFSTRVANLSSPYCITGLIYPISITGMETRLRKSFNCWNSSSSVIPLSSALFIALLNGGAIRNRIRKGNAYFNHVGSCSLKPGGNIQGAGNFRKNLRNSTLKGCAPFYSQKAGLFYS